MNGLLLIVSVLIVQLSSLTQEHFSDLAIHPFRTAGTIDLPANDHNMILPEKLLVYTSGSTINIQRLYQNNKANGTLQVKNHGTNINQLHISPDGQKICIVDADKKIYSFVNNDLNQFQNQQVVYADGTEQKAAMKLKNKGLIFSAAKTIYVFQFNQAQKKFSQSLSFDLGLTTQNSNFKPEKLDISENLEYIYTLYLDQTAPYMRNTLQIIKSQSELINEKFVSDFYYSDSTASFHYIDNLYWTNKKMSLQKYSQTDTPTITQKAIWLMKQNDAYVDQHRKTDQQLSKNFGYVMINWPEKNGFKLIQIEKLDPAVQKQYLLSDFYINSNLIANLTARPDERTYIQVKNKQDSSSIDLYSECHYSCKQCNSEGVCETCDALKKREDATSIYECKCMDKFFDIGLELCSACHYSCSTCEDTSTKCLTCSSDDKRTINSNKCPCNAGFFDNDVATCSACHYSCSTCEDTSTKCLTCSSDDKRTIDSNNCPCNAGFFNKGIATCLPCHYSCLTCEDTSTKCLTCNADHKRTIDNNSCPCNAGFFDSGVATCQVCHQTCSTCEDTSTKCLTCNADDKRTISSNNCPCSAGFFDNGVVTCSACHYSCLTCEDTSTKCLTCNADDKRTISSNQCPCNAGFFDNDVATCSVCHYSCLTCEDTSTKCLTCNADDKRTISSNNCPCNAGFFDNGAATCSACHYSCLTCEDTSTKCLTCNADDKRTISSNNCPCNAGFFDNGVATCQVCHQTCSRCDGTTKTDCISCITRFFKNSTNQQCQSCHYSCLNCFKTNNNCINCNMQAHREPNGPQCRCTQGYFDDGQGNELCQLCDFTCKTCKSVRQNCTSCSSAANRILNKQNCVCVDGYFENGNEICPSCHFSCKTCITAQDICTSCNSTAKREKKGDSCICENGYFDDQKNQACQKCHISCATCKNNSTCETCSASYFDNGDQLCQKCHYSCATCIGARDNCSSCNSYAKRVKDDKNNCACQQGYFNEADNEFCYTCHYSCASCSNSSSCDSCAEGFQEFGEQSVCFRKQFNIDLKQSTKTVAKNEISLFFELDKPIKIAENETKVEIVSHKNQSINWEVTQQQESSVRIIITYNSSVQKRTIKITFFTFQETGRRVLAVLVPVFQGEVEIQTYPPAQIISQTSIQLHDKMRQAVLGTSATLLILLFIGLFIPRAQFYVFKYSWTTPKLFIAFGICPEIMTQWLKYSLQPISHLSYVLGFETYECCQASQHLKYTANISVNSGIPVSILLTLWAIYVPIRFCLKNKLVLMYYRLFIVTASLIFLPHLMFAMINAFHDSAHSELNIINVIISCLLLILLVLFVIKLFKESMKLPISNDQISAEIHEQKEQQNSVSLQPVKVLYPLQKKKLQAEDQQKWLKISYQSCLSNRSKPIRLYLILALAKLFVFCLFCSVLQGGQLGLYIVLIFVDSGSEISYMVIFRPQRHIIKLLIEIVLHLCWATTYVMMCIYVSEFNNGIYSPNLQSAILGLILGILGYTIILLIVNVISQLIKGPENKQIARVMDITYDKFNPNSNVQIQP